MLCACVPRSAELLGVFRGFLKFLNIFSAYNPQNARHFFTINQIQDFKTQAPNSTKQNPVIPFAPSVVHARTTSRSRPPRATNRAWCPKPSRCCRSSCRCASPGSAHLTAVFWVIGRCFRFRSCSRRRILFRSGRARSWVGRSRWRGPSPPWHL